MTVYTAVQHPLQGIFPLVVNTNMFKSNKSQMAQIDYMSMPKGRPQIQIQIQIFIQYCTW